MSATSDIEFLKSVTSFYFSCGGFFGGYSNVTVNRTDNGAMINVSPSILIEHSISETEKSLSIDEWQSFINDIYIKYRLEEWNTEYINNDVLDGTQWEVKVKLANGKELEYYGSNDYPQNWTDFIDYINNLIAFSGLEF